MERTDEETLEALEAEISREEAEIAALRKRTRTLEIEVGAWKPPSKPLGTLMAEDQRAKLEVLVGAVLALAVFGLGWALLTVIKWGHS